MLNLNTEEINKKINKAFGETGAGFEQIQRETVLDWFYNGEAINDSLEVNQSGNNFNYHYSHPRAAIIHEGGVTEYGNKATKIPFIFLIVKEYYDLSLLFLDNWED